MRLKPQTDGTLKVELSAADRRALNTVALLAQLIKEHEATARVRDAADQANHFLEAILDYYPQPKAKPKPAAEPAPT